ncbi:MULTISPECIES: hypothetical protein [Cyanophyceae]|uniref:hypothetical protein n=1 Tax=Cyanophyceae TaxID=3028117 RepID=UPI001689A3B7|nr:hypothetical protein [Trichocoleus sp. FACHB-40]MBD2005138.1 hypothetical protein [Trichocoleus sp. FACHB-40]
MNAGKGNAIAPLYLYFTPPLPSASDKVFRAMRQTARSTRRNHLIIPEEVRRNCLLQFYPDEV